MKIIYVLLFFIFGCSIDSPIKYYGVFIENSFTQNQQVEISAAVSLWDISFNNEIDLEILDHYFDPSDSHRLYEQSSIVILSKISNNSTILGLGGKSKGIGHVIIFTNTIYDSEIKGVVLHELGHVFGAKHTNHGLMYPEYSVENYLCIDKLTTEQVEKAMGLEQNSMLYCEN